MLFFVEDAPFWNEADEGEKLAFFLISEGDRNLSPTSQRLTHKTFNITKLNSSPLTQIRPDFLPVGLILLTYIQVKAINALFLSVQHQKTQSSYYNLCYIYSHKSNMDEVAMGVIKHSPTRNVLQEDRSNPFKSRRCNQEASSVTKRLI